jgi:3-oxoacyl-[acyl-carrier protein] reductase
MTNKKVVVVTGGAKGIGKAIVEKFLTENYRVAILDYDSQSGQQFLEDHPNNKKDILFIKTDISNNNSVENAKKEVISRFKTIDVLVLNAAVSFRKSVSEMTIEERKKVIDINLTGSFLTVKSFYDELEKQDTHKRKLIFITSGSGITGTGGGVHYAASKSGQHGLMRGLSKELGPIGVNVNAVAPRVIQTEMLDVLYPTKEKKEELINKIPIGRVGEKEDIANLTYFLAQDEASYIHGQIILADGGRTY